MNYDNYNRYQNLKRKTVNPRLDQNCTGQCNSTMIKLGFCNCAKSKPKKKKNAFFQYRFWIIVMFALMIASWFFHINFLPSILIILLIYVYFQFIKK